MQGNCVETFLHAYSCVPKLLLMLLIMFGTLTPCGALSCVQCVSVKDNRCHNAALSPSPCEGHFLHAVSCIKVESISNIGRNTTHVTMRMCSNESMDKHCVPSSTLIGNRPISVCTYYCFTDGCNAASTFAHISMTSAVFVLAFVIASLLFLEYG